MAFENSNRKISRKNTAYPLGVTPHRMMFDIGQFCELHSMSRDFFEKLREHGYAPRITRIGRKQMISWEDAAEWRARMARECPELPTPKHTEAA